MLRPLVAVARVLSRTIDELCGQFGLDGAQGKPRWMVSREWQII